MPQNSFPPLSTIIARAATGVIFTAVVWLPYSIYLAPGAERVFAYASYLLIFLWLLLLGILLKSFLAAVFGGLFVFLVLTAGIVMENFSQVSFWGATAVKNIAASQSGIILVSFFSALVSVLVRKKLPARADHSAKVHTHPLFAGIISCAALAVLVLAVAVPAYTHQLTAAQLFTLLQPDTRGTKVEKITSVSPEQALEYYLSSIESGNYKQAYFATAGYQPADTAGYLKFVDTAKEEDIQLSRPLSHQVEKNQATRSDSSSAAFTVYVERENKSRQEYQFKLINKSGSWLVDSRDLVRHYF